MRGTRIAYILIVASLLALAGASLLLSDGAVCARPAPAGALSEQLADLATLAPGAAFDITAPPEAWAGWLMSQVRDPTRSPVAGVTLQARPDLLSVDLCLRQAGRLPTRLHGAFAFALAADGVHFTCVELAVGRLTLPAPLRALVSRQLDAAWRQWAGEWRLTQIELDAGRMRIAGNRR